MTYTTDELEQMGEAYFGSYPEVNTFVATTDGNFFLPEMAAEARIHAQQFGLEVKEVVRPALAGKRKGK